MSASAKQSTFWEELQGEVFELVKPRNLILYGVVALAFSVVSLVLTYELQVYASIVAGIAVALLLVASLVALRGFIKLDMVFVGGIIFLIIALFPKEYLTSLLPTIDVLRDFKHLSRILSIGLTALYTIMGVFQRSLSRPHGAHMKSLSNFFSVCNTTISSELCACLHPIPLVDMLLAPLGAADLLTNRVKLGFVIMMISLILQIRSSYNFYKNKNKEKREQPTR